MLLPTHPAEKEKVEPLPVQYSSPCPANAAPLRHEVVTAHPSLVSYAITARGWLAMAVPVKA
jgi:hypothetical protein